MSKFRTVIGIDFRDADGKHVVSYQLVEGSVAVAVADYEDGKCVRFHHVDRVETAATAWAAAIATLDQERVTPAEVDAAFAAILPKPAEPAAPDFRVENHGSIVLIRPLTESFKTWLHETAPQESQWYARALVVEPRYVENFLAVANHEGFSN